LPTGESLEKINGEAYPEDYHGPREDNKDKSSLIHPKKWRRTPFSHLHFLGMSSEAGKRSKRSKSFLWLGIKLAYFIFYLPCVTNDYQSIS
jgi:hypothetical protein